VEFRKYFINDIDFRLCNFTLFMFRIAIILNKGATL
jgi:hypothetical protein